jgi:iron complex outermembrane receptor protein
MLAAPNATAPPAAPNSLPVQAAGATPGVVPSDPDQAPVETSQDVNAGSAGSVAEVVVTAQRRAESNQSVPVAISAFTDNRRNLLGIEDGRDIANYTPSVSLNGEFLSIRGVGRFTDSLGTDPGVAVYVDGIYTNSPDYLSQPDIFTDRIEVLRGPQSTFGRNSIGGAINIISKRPTDEFYAEARAGGTDYNSGYGEFVLSGPITDTLKFRLGYDLSYQGNGYQNNVAPYSSVDGNGTSRVFDGQLEWKPTSKLDVWFRFQNYSSEGRPQYGQIVGPYQSNTLAYDGLALNPQFGLNPNSNPALHNAFDVNVNDPGFVKLSDDNTATLHITYNVGGAKLNYIGGYSHYNYASGSDADLTARSSFEIEGIQVPTNYQVATTLTKSYYSHELNLTSDDSRPLKYVAGAYYYWENNSAPYYVEDVDQPYFADPYTSAGPAPPNPTRAYYQQYNALHSVSEALYGQLDYDLTNQLRLTGSLRYNWDQKSASESYRYVTDSLVFGQVGYSYDGTPTGAVQSIKRDFSAATGKVGVEYKPIDRLLTYASITKGYKSGGFDLGNFSPIPVVKPETLYSYEVGAKAAPNRSLLLDADFYYYDYYNLQVPITVTSNLTGGAGDITTPTLTSAQRARSYGFELETIYTPPIAPDLHLTLTYSYENAKFERFTNSLFATGGIEDTSTGTSYANLDGNTLPQSPTNKVTFIPQYVFHVLNGDLSVSSILSYVDSQYYAVFNTSNYQAPSYYNLDLRAVFQPKGHWTAILYARNVTNQTQISNYAAGGAGIATENVFYTYAPRVVGGELQYRF